MNQEQRDSAKQITANRRSFEFLKEHMMDLKQPDLDGSMQDIGAQYKARKMLIEEMEQKFRELELVV